VSRYLAGRVLEIIPVVVLVSIATFVLIHLVPGDPARLNLRLSATPEQVEKRRVELGLDQPLPTQYWNFVSGAATLDFGRSIDTGEDVRKLIIRRAGPSLLLVAYSLVICILIAVPLATLAAVRRGTWVDQAIRLASTVTFVMPAFWLALLLIMVVSLRMGVLPSSGYGETFPAHVESLTLPAVTMGLGLSPLLLRLLRSSVIETMQTEYVEAARVRGLSEARVMCRHVLRTSLMSTVTLLGILLGVLLSATVIVEQIFSIPGLGSLLVLAVDARDIPVVQALALLFGLAVPVASLLTDLVYASLDPRVRL
jgi:peptide/nickel transport system permease protein